MITKTHGKKVLTIVTEAALEGALTREIEALGATGYTITDARGKGSRGIRSAGWDSSSNIRIEIVCSDATAEAITEHLEAQYYSNYSMILYLTDAQVLRKQKF
jgi:hypothetical protein